MCGCRHKPCLRNTSTSTKLPRPTVARIFPQNLAHNLARVRELAPRSKVMACVKANGYGHGLVSVAEVLAPQSDALAVATLEEAVALRSAGITAPILLMEGVHEPGDWHSAVRHHLTVAVSDTTQLEWLEAAPPESAPLCWLKLDTGMHRLGLPPEMLGQALARLRASAVNEDALTLMTHFASADETASSFSLAQLRCFVSVTQSLGLARSTANSAAILSLPDSHLDWVRPGYMLYGGSPFADRDAQSCGLLPAMHFCSTVISLREVEAGEPVGYGGRWVAPGKSKIATVAAGYGDGYPRHARDGTPVIIRGRRAPLAGRVSMDMLTVDVTDLDSVAVGDPVTLWGDALPVDEIAASCETIGYELLARMPARVPRQLCP